MVYEPPVYPEVSLERIADALERIADHLDEQAASRLARTRMGPA